MDVMHRMRRAAGRFAVAPGRSFRRSFGRTLGALATLALALVAAAMLVTAAAAQDDPPGRVGRIAEMQGKVYWFESDSGRWLDAERNRPLTGGDRVSTAADGRAELRVGSTTLRLGHASELEVLRLDDERMVFQLHAGEMAVRVRSREVARGLEIVTPEARLAPQRSGHYRFDRIDDSTWAGAWRGEIRVADLPGGLVAAGQRAELYREGGGLRMAMAAMPTDEFADWAVRADRRDDQRSASQRYVSPEMTGADDLDRYGRWEQSPDYGPIWYPIGVPVGWAPYRDGRWAWVEPWGWTWLDDAPWGFAPFHYGRWAFWGGRWGWCPGGYVARPVFAPALVAWIGGAHWSVSVNIGGPAVGWVPLAPREPFVPWYRHTPRYGDRINVPLPDHRAPPPRQVPTGPIMYTNQGVPGGVTVVPRDVLQGRQPIARAVIGVPDAARRPFERGEAPPPPERRGNGRHADDRGPGWTPQREPGRVPQPRAERSEGPRAVVPVPPVQVVPGAAVPVPPRLRPVPQQPQPQQPQQPPPPPQQQQPQQPALVVPQRPHVPQAPHVTQTPHAPQTPPSPQAMPVPPPPQAAQPPAPRPEPVRPPPQARPVPQPPAQPAPQAAPERRPTERAPERAPERAQERRDDDRKRIPEPGPRERERLRDREAAR